MGYTTDFEGQFTISPPLDPAQVRYLTRFSGTRRVTRNALMTAKRVDRAREAVGLPVGIQGGYFVGATAEYGQEHGAADIVGYNYAPKGQPGLWCQWEPNAGGDALRWNGAEKFYCYEEWLQYIITHFLKPWGRVLSGKVTWQGADPKDRGQIIVTDNVITTRVLE